MKWVCFYGEIKLICRERKDVASRRWWTIEWIDQNGNKQFDSAQDIEKMMWRAITRYIKIEEKII